VAQSTPTLRGPGQATALPGSRFDLRNAGCCDLHMPGLINRKRSSTAATCSVCNSTAAYLLCRVIAADRIVSSCNDGNGRSILHAAGDGWGDVHSALVFFVQGGVDPIWRDLWGFRGVQNRTVRRQSF